MTLCAAWIRSTSEGRELVFATDSRLRGAEEWDSGVKLFDLGREDCLLCFAGDTHRAYPLILHSLNSARINSEWRNPRLDISDVLLMLCRTFTDLCKTISDRVSGESIHTASAQAEFLFGGWSWRENRFGVWRIFYSQAENGFTQEAWHIDDPARVIIFLGDKVAFAEDQLALDLIDNRKYLRGGLDMEPLQVIAKMSRDRAHETIGGALQVAKVYASGHSEFFGIMWPSTTNGEPYFMGRKLNLYDAPPMRFIDPDSAQFIDTLPQTFADLEAYDFGSESTFVRQCYDNGTQLKATLTDAQRERLIRIVRDIAYREFLQSRHRAELFVDSVGATEADVPMDQTREG